MPDAVRSNAKLVESPAKVGGSQHHTRPRLVALAVYATLVEKHCLILVKTGANRRDDVPGPNQAGLAMSDATVSLLCIGVKPVVNEAEPGTAMVNLIVAVSSRFPGLENRD